MDNWGLTVCLAAGTGPVMALTVMAVEAAGNRDGVQRSLNVRPIRGSRCPSVIVTGRTDTADWRQSQ
jgi:hypothetical protein